MIKKADIVLLIIILVVGIPLSVLSLTEGIGGDKVRISLDGEIYGVYPLGEDREIDVTEDGHTNHKRRSGFNVLFYLPQSGVRQHRRHFPN